MLTESLDLLVIGDVSVDLFMQIESSNNTFFDPQLKETKICFFHGAKVPVNKYKQVLAGNTTHVSVGCARLGLKTGVYTELGDDEYADKFLKFFENEHINTDLTQKIKNTETNVHAVIVANKERTIFSYHKICNYDLDFSKVISPKMIYYTSLSKGFEKFQKKLLKYINENPGTMLIFNPGSMQLRADPDVIKEVMSKTQILFVNKEEAQHLTKATKHDSTLDLHKKLGLMGPNLTVITDGENGSSAYSENKMYDSPAPNITEFIDKTGSGDSYAAAFLSALFYKKSINTALEWGNKNAANTMKYIGAVDGLLTLEKMNNYKLT